MNTPTKANGDGTGHRYAVVLAGGAGTRLWPASRVARPKQLVALAGGTESLLAATVRRLAARIPLERIFVATAAHLADATAAILDRLPRENLLVEPASRNTAPSIGWATHVIARRDPNALIGVFPSDHFIRDERSFLEHVDEAFASAERGRITMLGLTPTRPETGYGYIERGEVLRGVVHAVRRFVEKPSRERAERYLADERYLWNGGMFFYRAPLMIDAIRHHLPELAHGLARLDAAAARGVEASVLRDVFPTLPSISIDHGVIERERGLAVLAASFGWSDVGTWESTWELADKDGLGNAMPEDAVVVESTGNLVRDLRTQGPRRVYAFVGISDLVLVETDDAVLLVPRQRAQDVRAVVDALKARRRLDVV